MYLMMAEFETRNTSPLNRHAVIAFDRRDDYIIASIFVILNNEEGSFEYINDHAIIPVEAYYDFKSETGRRSMSGAIREVLFGNDISRHETILSIRESFFGISSTPSFPFYSVDLSYEKYAQWLVEVNGGPFRKNCQLYSDSIERYCTEKVYECYAYHNEERPSNTPVIRCLSNQLNDYTESLNNMYLDHASIARDVITASRITAPPLTVGVGNTWVFGERNARRECERSQAERMEMYSLGVRPIDVRNLPDEYTFGRDSSASLESVARAMEQLARAFVEEEDNT